MISFICFILQIDLFFFSLFQALNVLYYINLALLVAKFYIYRCSLDDTPLYFLVFETELREKARIEKDIATRNGNLKHFKIKWEPLISSKFIGDVDI